MTWPGCISPTPRRRLYLQASCIRDRVGGSHWRARNGADGMSQMRAEHGGGERCARTSKTTTRVLAWYCRRACRGHGTECRPASPAHTVATVIPGKSTARGSDQRLVASPLRAPYRPPGATARACTASWLEIARTRRVSQGVVHPVAQRCASCSSGRPVGRADRPASLTPCCNVLAPHTRPPHASVPMPVQTAPHYA